MNGFLENIKIYGDKKDKKWLYENWDCYDGPDKRHARMVVEGDYTTEEKRHFVIVAHHTGTPNAYIQVFPWDSIFYDEEGPIREDWRSDSLSSVHCGSTYYGPAYWNRENDDRTYIGWDYGHAGDYTELPAHWGIVDEGHKWNVAEIMMEIARAAYELDERNEEDNEYWDRRKKMKERK